MKVNMIELGYSGDVMKRCVIGKGLGSLQGVMLNESAV